MSEHDEQCALFQWAELAARHDSRLELLFAVPNGGHRHGAIGAKLKAEGVKAGVPDILLPVPSNGFNGLAIEMKFGSNKCKPSQIWWLRQLKAQGWAVAVCYSWEKARRLISVYLRDENVSECVSNTHTKVS